MAYSRQHLRITWGGSLPGLEQWSTGVRMTGSGTSAGQGAVTQASVDNVAGIIDAWWSRATTWVHERAQLDWVKLAAIGTDGHYLGEPATFSFVGDNPGPVSNSVMLPNQVCYVVTLETDSRFGLARVGRCYVPLPAFQAGTDGRIPSNLVGEAAESFGGLLTGLNTGFGADLTEEARVVVMSAAGSGVTRPVIGVRVGDVLDTMRSRREALRENYTSRTVLPPSPEL